MLLLCCTLGYSKVVTLSTAQAVGYNFLVQKGSSTLSSPTDLQLLYTSGASPALFYVFGKGKSFVIVSAEDNATPVLGYSLNNAFKADNMPSNVSGFLDEYSKQITYIRTNNLTASKELATNWNNLINNIKTSRSTERTTSVSPLLSTTWDQSPYYNADCPYDAGAGANCVTGCVATATAQVMKYWNWPTTGTGFFSYTSSSYGTLSSSFASHTYDWSAMPASVSSSCPSVALLMSDVGISVAMNYTPTESSAYVISSYSAITNCAEYALKTYFNYDASLNGQLRSSYSDATWISMLEADLDASRPVIYFGSGSGGGHCFVFDGYDNSSSTTTFHVNWGWSGYADGYFTIDALDPAPGGTGGGSYHFDDDQGAIFGVKPGSGGGGGGGGTTTDTLVLYSPVYVVPDTINYAGAFTVSDSVANFGSTSFTGDFCAAVFDYTTLSFITIIDSIMGVTVPSGYLVGMNFSTAGLYSMLPDRYRVGIFYRSTGDSWAQAWNYGTIDTNLQSMVVVNSASMELYTAAMAPSPTTFVQGSPATVTLSIKNTGTSAFSGNYEVVLLNDSGTIVSTIQVMTGMALAAGATTSPLTFSTSSVTAAPGTYLLAAAYSNSSSSSSYYYLGADYYTNPIYITVAAPPPAPDMYERDNTIDSAYLLPLTFTANVASTSTPGSNFHIVTDQDFYKIRLGAGYSYSITARVNDVISHDDAVTYTTDALWTYSIDSGAHWSAAFEGPMMPSGSTINIPASAGGGTVFFHVTPASPGDLGTYLLKISNVTRIANESVPEVDLSAIKIYPNPSSDFVTIDLQQANVLASTVVVTDIEGKKVYTTNVSGQSIIKIPVHSLASGMYFVEISTESGVISRKITVTK